MGRYRSAALAVSFILGPAVGHACIDSLAELDTGDGRFSFSVEIADSPDERARGLMFRRDLPRDTGMLFVFEDSAPRAFWMENTPLSLDMLFFDNRGVLCGLVERAEPFTRTPRRSGCDARLVLEIHGGLAEELGIVPGTRLRHPAVGSEAAWACTAP
jgi:uncharacterized membrane protein (UPF0127 family)